MEGFRYRDPYPRTPFMWVKKGWAGFGTAGKPGNWWGLGGVQKGGLESPVSALGS